MFRRLRWILLLAIPMTQAATWRVERDGSGHYTSIQPAVDAAAPGDTILIGPGRYTESTTFPYDNEHGEGETYVGVQVDSLTLIGCHRDSVIIGPDTPSFLGFLPKGIATRLGFVTNLTVQDLSLQNVFEGVRLDNGGEITRYRAIDCGHGVFSASGTGPRVQDSLIEGSTEGGVSLFRVSGGEVTNVRFEREEIARDVIVVSSRDVRLQQCEFFATGIVEFSGGSIGTVRNCTFSDALGPALQVSEGSIVTLENNRFVGAGQSIICIEDSYISGSGNQFRMSSPHTMYFGSRSWASLQGNDIRLATGGYTVRLSGYDLNPELIQLDLRNNYWGTTDPMEISSGILDINDDPEINGVVLFDPLRVSSVPASARSLGELKSLFKRGGD